ncbi:hypothetical protein BC833DRAFT_612356 [Globomyces pollinis-pini]|nr:hypothetical protein BC833DRAFT_612356 [Globomyces pollinis-pini]
MRIKAIMKADQDVHNVTLDGVYAVSIATQLFLDLLLHESHQFTTNDNRKKLLYADVANAINDIHEFEFLTEIVPNTMPYDDALNRRAAFQAIQDAQKDEL